jgi:glyoxylase I family protein
MVSLRALGVCCVALGMAGWMVLIVGPVRDAAATAEDEPGVQAGPEGAAGEERPAFRSAGVRYLVKDVDRSVAFYTKHLDFELEQQAGQAFASVSNGGLILKLSGPKSSGARPLPDGRAQEPGGWNRVVLEVDDLSSRVAAMRRAGFHFRTEIEIGPGGKQIQLEDPDGNPVELFEPAS